MTTDNGTVPDDCSLAAFVAMHAVARAQSTALSFLMGYREIDDVLSAAEYAESQLTGFAATIRKAPPIADYGVRLNTVFLVRNAATVLADHVSLLGADERARRHQSTRLHERQAALYAAIATLGDVMKGL